MVSVYFNFIELTYTVFVIISDVYAFWPQAKIFTIIDQVPLFVNNLFERFVTRPDVKKQKLAEFQDWCLIGMEKANGLCTNDD